MNASNRHPPVADKRYTTNLPRAHAPIYLSHLVPLSMNYSADIEVQFLASKVTMPRIDSSATMRYRLLRRLSERGISLYIYRHLIDSSIIVRAIAHRLTLLHMHDVKAIARERVLFVIVRP